MGAESECAILDVEGLDRPFTLDEYERFLQDREALFACCFVELAIAAEKRQRQRIFAGSYQGRGQLKGVGCAQGMHA
jgi:hypothetical protein